LASTISEVGLGITILYINTKFGGCRVKRNNEPRCRIGYVANELGRAA